MIDATQNKLDEARFFYEKLRAQSRKVVRNEPEGFGHYLSAFLSAARSVTLVLQAEEKKRYDAWFPGWIQKCSAEEKDILKFMNNQRVAEVHKTGAQTTAVGTAVPVSHLRPEEIGGTFCFSAPPGTPAPEFIRTDNIFPGLGDADVAAKCKDYVDVLSRLVDEFRRDHP